MTCRLLTVSLTTLAIVVACSPAKSTANDKNTFSEYEIVNKQQITWEEIFFKNDNYVVFFYNETCAYCHEMLNEIIDFASENVIPTYFLDTNQNDVVFRKDVKPILYVTSIDDFFIVGTPTILEIKDGVVVANIPGLDECLTYMNGKRMNTNIIL